MGIVLIGPSHFRINNNLVKPNIPIERYLQMLSAEHILYAKKFEEIIFFSSVVSGVEIAKKNYCSMSGHPQKTRFYQENTPFFEF